MQITKPSAYFKTIISVTLLLIIVLGSYSFSSTPVYTTPGFISKSSFEFNEQIGALDKAAGEFKAGKISIDSLQKSVLAARISYKKIEFYLAFHFGEYIKENINGAPLLHIEKEGTRPKVVEPRGLQVLDEMVFADNANEEKAQIAILVKNLKGSYSILFNELDKNKRAGTSGIAAMRIQLVRILSLGITGFDTPGSLNALPEAVASLQGMKDFFSQNYKADDTKGKAIMQLFEGGIADLKSNKDFNNFDRLTFIKNYLDPLYKQLGTYKDESDPEFMARTTAWNADSKSIFGNDFLNPYYFTNLKKEDDSAELRALGKTLFYDPVVSGDNKMSCATCHNPDKGFSDGVPKSLSNVQGKTVLRNAPTLLNAVFADRYFYDLRAFTLEQQAEHVIFNKDEFNTAYTAILKKLNSNTNYVKKFKSVFGRKEVTRDDFSKALASYVLSLQSFNSDFDKYVRGESTSIAPDVKNGFNLFMGKATCATCHFAPTFSGLVPPFYNENESEILGVLENPKANPLRLDADNGRLGNEVYTEYAWIYEKSFKTTTVRNAALTAPYFHNGAYGSLEEVIDFYNKGGGTGLGFTVKNQTLPPDQLGLTEKETQDLIAFIKSLTDVSSAK